MASVFPPDQNSVFGETGGQSVDTGSSSLIQTDFSQSGLSAIDADEGVDPVAEADVYMAYGRDAQAEEILLDALKGDPNRTAVHLKLMEIYGQRKNMKQFETTATELYSVTGGNGPDWVKAAEMGRKLDPDNPLFLRGPQSEIDLPLDDELPADEDFKAAPPADDSEAFSAPAAEAPVPPKAAAPAEVDAPSDIDAAIDGEDNAEMSLDLSASVPNPDAPSPSQLKDTWAIPGDLNQFTDSDLEAAASAQGEAVSELDQAASETLPEGLDAGDLDFDLELDDAVEPPAADAASMEATEVAGRTLNDSFTTTDTGLEFNLDLAEPDETADASLDSTRVNGVDDTETDLGKVSDLEFDADVAASAPDTAKEEGPDERVEDVGSESVVDLEKTNFDGSLLDFDFDLDEAKAAEGDDSPMMATSLDLSDISLDLEGADDAPSEVEATPAASEDTPPVAESEADTTEDLDDVPPVFDEPAPSDARKPVADEAAQEDDMMASLSKSVVTSLTDSRSMPDMPDDDELNQEVDTKLELARAYEEMGDAEGARELLEEVIRDGNDAQQEQARAVFARLG
ncbi:FimV/HubP family polar landmark protein [Denitromonas sp.]|uniref:FimV/HubP family polar landmark protein n=1 Tax=Denitromonas sp. TaxID=2734609 RepID=UPI002AFE5F4B|nr:FimV/HubP family polar landmark protein [Denitromonas sp.]